MATLRDIRRRIRSVESTQKITRAMKLVAAAKLRRAQDRILSTRPYALKMLEVLNSLATRADPNLHPLLTVRDPERVEVVVVTADKGLCGSFNANILKEATRFLELARAEELLGRLDERRVALERLADAGEVDGDAAVDLIAEIAELARQIEAELTRARTIADASG